MKMAFSVVTHRHVVAEFRKEFPKQLIRKKKEMVRGEYHLLFNGSVAAIVWMDNKPIYFVTSLYITSPDEHVLHYDPNLHSRVPVPSPKAVKSYNEYMGGTDRNDQMTKLQKCRRHYKWPRRLVMKFFLWAAYNSYVLKGIVRCHSSPGHRSYTFHLFVETLCEQLVGTVQNKNRAFGHFNGC